MWHKKKTFKQGILYVYGGLNDLHRNKKFGEP